MAQLTWRGEEGSRKEEEETGEGKRKKINLGLD